MWANWLRDFIPRDKKNFQSYSERVLATHTETTIRKHPGDPKSQKIKCVCAPCNNEWMSVIQNDTKSTLVPLLRGENILLHKKAQTVLATWITLFTMVAEHFDKTEMHVAVSKIQRHTFKQTKRTPKGWRIWIACYEGKKWKGEITRNTVPVSDDEHTPERSSQGFDLPNTQTTTFFIGKLFVHVYSSFHADAVRKKRSPAPEFLVQLWPIAHSPIQWPLAQPIPDAAAERVAIWLSTKASRGPPASLGS